MKNAVSPGIWIGVLCALWQVIWGYAGWYKHPVNFYLFYAVILIQVCVLIWGLKRTASDGNTYWHQVGAGTLMSLVAAAILFCTSLIFTTYLFPHALEEMRAVQAEMMKQAGRSEAEIKTAMELAAKSQTPLIQALFGVIGTTVTGFLASMVIGAFIRNKQQRVQ